MADRRLEPRFFDRNEPLVTAKQLLVHGELIAAGDPVPDTLDVTQRIRGWTLGRFVYQKDYEARAEKFAPPMTAQDVADAKEASLKEPVSDQDETEGNEDYELDYGVEGEDRAVLKSLGGGWYEITSPGAEPEKVQGKDNAEKRLIELRAEAEGED